MLLVSTGQAEPISTKNRFSAPRKTLCPGFDQLQHLRAEPARPPLAIKRLENQLGRSFDIALFGAGTGTATQLLGLNEQSLALLAAAVAIAAAPVARRTGAGEGARSRDDSGTGAGERRGGRETGHRSCGGRRRNGADEASMRRIGSSAGHRRKPGAGTVPGIAKPGTGGITGGAGDGRRLKQPTKRANQV